jgi:hypothetical protein
MPQTPTKVEMSEGARVALSSGVRFLGEPEHQNFVVRLDVWETTAFVQVDDDDGQDTVGLESYDQLEGSW